MKEGNNMFGKKDKDVSGKSVMSNAWKQANKNAEEGKDVGLTLVTGAVLGGAKGISNMIKKKKK